MDGWKAGRQEGREEGRDHHEPYMSENTSMMAYRLFNIEQKKFYNSKMSEINLKYFLSQYLLTGTNIIEKTL